MWCKITLLSNNQVSDLGQKQVLDPYKITLLSNRSSFLHLQENVLDPYKITLLSNIKLKQEALSRGIVQMENALGGRLSHVFSFKGYSSKKDFSLASHWRSFFVLSLQKQCRARANYTTLKLKTITITVMICFRPLQNYTTLKPQIRVGSVIEGYSSNGKCAWLAFESCFLF